MRIQKILISQIKRDERVRTRPQLDEQRVKKYQKEFSDSEPTLPVTVFFDDVDYWLGDGLHRIVAAERLGFVDIDVNVKRGDRREALLYALGQSHPRKKPQIEYILDIFYNNEGWLGKMSGWDIEKLTGISHSKASGYKRVFDGHRRNPRRDQRKYGKRLDYPNFTHEPENELGVILLFGMVAERLGFSIESIQEGFPDCDAKRREVNDRGKEYLRRVLIEFEYNSKHFVHDGHDPDGCHLIVCWKHDWPDCPLEVIELSKIIK
jgi:hypothetical protein